MNQNLNFAKSIKNKSKLVHLLTVSMDENDKLKKKIAWRDEAIEDLKKEVDNLMVRLEKDANWWKALDKEAM